MLQAAFLEGTCACSEIRNMKSNNLMDQKTLKFVTVRTKGILRNGNVPLFFEIELFFTNIWEGCLISAHTELGEVMCCIRYLIMVETLSCKIVLNNSYHFSF